MNLELEINAVILGIKLGDVKLENATNHFKGIAEEYAKEMCEEQKKICYGQSHWGKILSSPLATEGE